jgi:hypothetical protein
MNHESIKLTSMSKLFEFEKISREIEGCDNINELKNICKCYVKLYFSLEEMMQNLKVLVSE